MAMEWYQSLYSITYDKFLAFVSCVSNVIRKLQSQQKELLDEILVNDFRAGNAVLSTTCIAVSCICCLNLLLFVIDEPWK